MSLTVYFNDIEIEELFDVDINDGKLVLGTYAPWDLYMNSAYCRLDFGSDIELDFNVENKVAIQLGNGGWQITYDIIWLE